MKLKPLQSKDQETCLVAPRQCKEDRDHDTSSAAAVCIHWHRPHPTGRLIDFISALFKANNLPTI